MASVLALLAVLIGLSSVVSSQNCPDGKVFLECGTLCPRTCDNYMLDNACVQACAQGCFCPDDLVEHNGGCVSSIDCPTENSQEPVTSPSSLGDPNCETDNGGCPEDQICTVMDADVGSDYVQCQIPPYVPCGQDAFIACDSEFLYCLQQNKTRRANCVASCLSDNGGCGEDQICITQVGDDGRTDLQCQDVDDISTECPAGQVMNQCGAYCQETCEQRLSEEEFVCIEICGPPACVCPPGLLLFRDRCVDPRLCYVLLTYPPVIDPLPIVQSDQYLYSLFSPNSTASDFLEQQFLQAIGQVLNSRGYPYVDVNLHGIYAGGNDGLQIVVQLSGDDVNEDTSIKFTNILQENANELPLPVDQISRVDTDRVSAPDDKDICEKDFWTLWRITVVGAAGGLGMVVLLAIVIAAVVVGCCSGTNKTSPEKVNVEVFHLMKEDELKGESEKTEVLS